MSGRPRLGLTPWGVVHAVATQTYSSSGDVHLVVAGLRGGEGEGGKGDADGGAGGGTITCRCSGRLFVLCCAVQHSALHSNGQGWRTLRETIVSSIHPIITTVG